jgi:hypothetical protein
MSFSHGSTRIYTDEVVVMDLNCRGRGADKFRGAHCLPACVRAPSRVGEACPERSRSGAPPKRSSLIPTPKVRDREGAITRTRGGCAPNPTCWRHPRNQFVSIRLPRRRRRVVESHLRRESPERISLSALVRNLSLYFRTG